MSTGAEHYREAERVIRLAEGRDVELAAPMLAQAQVHATLALAAATADCGMSRMFSHARVEWVAAIEGEQPKTTSREYGVGTHGVGDVDAGRIVNVQSADTLRDAVEHAAAFGGTVAARTVTTTPWQPVDPTEMVDGSGS